MKRAAEGGGKALTTLKLAWLQECGQVAKATALELRICIEMALHYASMPETAKGFHDTGRLIVFPSQSALARTLSMSRQAVQKAIRRLIKRQMLVLAKQGGKGRNWNNRYELKRSSG